MPNLLQKEVHEAAQNCAPRSEVTVSGTPKQDTQEARKASMHEAVEMSFKGMASSHLVVLSMMVKM
jgi:hypothetical protein